MSAYEIHTLGNYPEESIQHLEHGRSLKSRMYVVISLHLGQERNVSHLMSRVYSHCIQIQGLGKKWRS